jgi:hypothetical protein
MDKHETEKLRAALARRERGRGKRHTPDLKQRIGEAARALRRQGQGWQTIGAFLGISHETVRRCCDRAPRRWCRWRSSTNRRARL